MNALALSFAGDATRAHSALFPAGIQAQRILDLGVVFFSVCTAVYVIVLGVLALATGRPRNVVAVAGAPCAIVPEREQRMTKTVSVAVAATVAILFFLLFADFESARAIQGLDAQDALVIRVTAARWWWKAEYQGATPSLAVTTANELHVPQGRTVKLELESHDVIHSFWAPGLHGKTDIIPLHPTHTLLRADRVGRFDGQCAEFCGLEHAKMRFAIVVEPPGEFERWLAGQRAPAAEPGDDEQRHGRDVFLGGTCVLCHTIHGTDAAATIGPDLTHLASRATIAAGSLPNVHGALAGWIVDPQHVKPGVAMPLHPLPPAELRALLAYLESLR